MDDGYCATTVMDGGGSRKRKRKWKGRGTEVWRAEEEKSVGALLPAISFQFPANL